MKNEKSGPGKCIRFELFSTEENNNHIRYPPQELDPILRVVEPVGQVMQPEFDFVWCGQPKNVPRGHCSQRSPFLPYPRLHTLTEKVYNYYEFRPSNTNSRCTVLKYK